MTEILSFDKAMLSMVLTEILDKTKYILKDIFLTETVVSTFNFFLFPNKSNLQKTLPDLN